MNQTALGDLFGSRAAESVFLHLFHYGETYGRAVSSDFSISLDSVQRQLEKFQGAGVLVSKRLGRTIVYTWNPKNRLAAKVKDLVALVYEGIPMKRRAELFAERRRPRAKDKPVIG
jgi:hypothetical protein